MQDVKPGEVGEIVHRSPHVMLGYFHDDERTAAAFEGGWFHSGDLGTIDDEGYITVVDRKKDMIKTGGENVASREVEEAIYRLPQVSEVAVVGINHPRWVEAVVAVIVVKAGHTLTEAEVLAHCNAHMAGFKSPKAVVFVDALPKNPSGKLLKRQLRQAHAELFGGGWTAPSQGDALAPATSDAHQWASNDATFDVNSGGETMRTTINIDDVLLAKDRQADRSDGSDRHRL